MFTTTLATGGSTVGAITNLQMLGVDVATYAFTDISVTHAGKTAMILSNSSLYDGTNTVNDGGSSGAKLSSFAGDMVDGEWTVTIRNYDTSSITFTDMAINLFYWE
ncbi:MAG: hypothetical protein A2Y38_06745 [Spirochaetes bacterium GWB1_59_5]|nr:MAG: hypothetical protein A2Y38_06745 [Spirochaetes bacterium GWB1_59_5]